MQECKCLFTTEILFQEPEVAQLKEFLLQTLWVMVLVSQKCRVANCIDYYWPINLELLKQSVVAVLNASRNIACISSWRAVLHSQSVVGFFCSTLVPDGIYRWKFLNGRCAATVKNVHAQPYETKSVLTCPAKEGNRKCNHKTNYLSNLIQLAAVVNFCQASYSELNVREAFCILLPE